MKSHRDLAPKEVTLEELAEVMWDVLHRLQESGVDIGPEAKALLQRKKAADKSASVRQ